jgi:hypothetical protein
VATLDPRLLGKNVDMERREFNRATLIVAINRDLSGGAAADAANRGLQIGRGRTHQHMAALTVLGSSMAASFLVGSMPMAWAQENEHGIWREVEALEAKVTSLEQTVSALQNQIGSLQTSNTTLRTQLTAVQSNHALLLDPFVSVDPNPEIGVIGPNIIFSGANIHIVSGSGATDDKGNTTGLGNLIIGYDEDPINPLTGDDSDGLPIMQAPGFPTALNPGDRSGSHNLVIGGGNRFTGVGGFVAGERNTVNGFGTSVSGGFNNTASGLFASVSGGVRNTAGAQFSSISGGGFNFTELSSGPSISGGFSNTVSGPFASVFGGYSNGASNEFAIVVGGVQNTAGGLGSVVLGGQGVSTSTFPSIAPQPPFP